MSGTGPNVPNDSAEVTRYEKTSTRPVRHCPEECSRSFGEHPKAALAARSCSIVLCGQAPKPRSGAPKARGLTAKPRIERRLAAMHVGIGHVREIKYQILQTLFLSRLSTRDQPYRPRAHHQAAVYVTLRAVRKIFSWCRPLIVTYCSLSCSFQLFEKTPEHA